MTRDEVVGGRAPDELDDLLDELLPVGDARVGAFDLVALASGTGLLGWSLLGAPDWAVPAGVAAVALGAILPVRAFFGRMRSHRSERRWASQRRNGTPLDTTAPQVRRLLDLHAQVVTAARGGSSDIALATHLALVEVATLLDGAGPTQPDELRFVAERADAVEAAMTRQGADGGGARRAARMEALAELDGVDRHSSLQRLQELSGDG